MIDPGPHDRPLLIADYGSSQGRNSLRPMRAAIAVLPRNGMATCWDHRVMTRAVGGLTNLLLTLLLPHMALSQPLLQPPVTPACVSSPFGWRHAVGPHAPAGFHNGLGLPAPAGAQVHAAAAGTIEMNKRQGLGGVTIHLRHPGEVEPASRNRPRQSSFGRSSQLGCDPSDQVHAHLWSSQPKRPHPDQAGNSALCGWEADLGS
jgi:murein DD-endopeptidase MepM/ murein hydrolase activator NlpD